MKITPLFVAAALAAANSAQAYPSFMEPHDPSAGMAARAAPQSSGNKWAGSIRQAANDAIDFFQFTRTQEDASKKPADQLTYTEENGRPAFSYSAVQRAGTEGPLLMQSTHLIDTLARFNRENIPERIVHSRGYGAHGWYEATSDFGSQYSMAEIFKKGTKVPVSMRFSTVGGRSGSADTARDPRGFSVKFRTSKGILDWVFNNTPVFFIRDPAKFPIFIHTQKTNNRNLRDKNAVFDYMWQNPESSLQFLRLFSDLGTPYSARFMSGWSGHTYRLVKEDGSWVYTKVLLETDQGVKNFTDAEASKTGAMNQEFATKDLYDAIDNKQYPSWTVKLAIKTPEEAAQYRYNVNDLTKDWPDANYTTVGKVTLTQNPVDYFAEIEQAHYSPSNMIDGWAPSEDPVLQSRLFAYNDAGRHRLGPNYMSIPVNCPASTVANFDRAGLGTVLGGNPQPNYPSSASKFQYVQPQALVKNSLGQNATVDFYSSQINEDLDYEQPRDFFEKQLSPQDQQNTISNFVGALSQVTQPGVVDNVLNVFGKISPKLQSGVKDGLAKANSTQSM